MSEIVDVRVKRAVKRTILLIGSSSSKGRSPVEP